ncbi:hypothetical protein GCM10028805_25920 [Spirosoma harenae]
MIKTANLKREILAQVLAGQIEALQAYKASQQGQQLPSDLRWVIDERPIGGSIYCVNHQGERIDMTVEEFEALPQPVPLWRIVDFTKGTPLPDVDADFGAGQLV